MPKRFIKSLTACRLTAFSLPFAGFRGTPTGIDVHAVADSGITPVMDIGIAGVGGGQIGAGLARAAHDPFAAASAALHRITKPNVSQEGVE